ncbi:MAG: bifunctional diaminohydroxyphosphoribosylaminopyrimidine deaminase/5-amino-6-(5-phosphoribosylamino)uracil reductase RibD [Rhizobiaceae bacterium]
MAAAIRFARINLGQTGTNPSVATLLVKDGIIVGRGVTAIGGRPHAETQAIAEAGELSRGSTAYVTLEPCAHHGRTPPCAEALVTAGVSRVVIAAGDPDPRVSGKGTAILRNAEIEVVEGILAKEAAEGLSGYLTRSMKKRPEVTLKLAISADGMIGRKGAGQVPITGDISRRMVHMMRAQSDAILVGAGTVEADDPQLTCRLPGLEKRSPIRIVLDGALRMPSTSKLATTAHDVPVWIAGLASAGSKKRIELQAAGCRILSCDEHRGKVALPELLDDLGAQGISSIMIEGGAQTAQNFMDERLVDRIVLFTSSNTVGDDGIASPVNTARKPAGFELTRIESYGSDTRSDYVKV